MLILIADDDVSFSFSLGGSDTSSAATLESSAIITNAGFFSKPEGLFEKVFSSAAFAKTELTLMDTETGMALIDRFESTAIAESEKLGIDSGVLLATAIAAGAVETKEQVTNRQFTSNFFGAALVGEYPSAWASWRAMSLAITASLAETSKPTRDDFVLAAATQFPDVDSAQKRIYEALRFYQL